MSMQHDIVTLEIGGVEQDLEVRGRIDVEPSPSRGVRAELDGPIEANVGGEWIDLRDLGVTSKDWNRALDELSDVAMSDDSGEDCEHEDDGDLDRDEVWS